MNWLKRLRTWLTAERCTDCGAAMTRPRAECGYYICLECGKIRPLQ